MRSNLNKEKYVAIIELSSTAIKSIYGLPKYVDKKKEDLRRFEFYDNIPFDVKSIIIKDHVNIDKFEKRILYDISKIAIRLSKKGLQSLRVVFTGTYRTIKNFSELSSVISKVVGKHIKLEKCSFDLLSPEEESYLSFFSWVYTLSEGAIETFYGDITFFHLNKGLHIDIGGGTTEVTVIDKQNFSNTISIPIGTYNLKNRILNEQHIIQRGMDYYSYAITNWVLEYLKEKTIPIKDIKYCVSSGSFVFIEPHNSSMNKLTFFYTSKISNDIEILAQNFAHYIYKYLNHNSQLTNNDDDFLKHYIGLNILKAILEYFQIEKYHINHANLRIGAYHDLCIKIKDSPI